MLDRNETVPTPSSLQNSHKLIEFILCLLEHRFDSGKLNACFSFWKITFFLWRKWVFSRFCENSKQFPKIHSFWNKQQFSLALRWWMHSFISAKCCFVKMKKKHPFRLIAFGCTRKSILLTTLVVWLKRSTYIHSMGVFILSMMQNGQSVQWSQQHECCRTSRVKCTSLAVLLVALNFRTLKNGLTLNVERFTISVTYISTVEKILRCE